ncbi:hypothetical protein SLEP1_g25975 [Rubroshorea leprosula]|uniref:Uncharacterized protein n=1 Tax=Rubroshorea leprosula TaxID=152421 RepID=A0AAV5JKR0_9ROSI|nr:hypothetical protein SLEP1_g25975 [Rubroshorea leprosula]
MSSEETVSVEGIRERFEREEERFVPQNILKRDNGQDGCFNPEEEVVSKASRKEGEDLFYLGNHWMPMSAHYLAVGLRFLILELLVWVLMGNNIGLTQLIPNAMLLVIAFTVYSRGRGLPFLTANVFKYFYVLKAGSDRERGWYYFTGRVWDKTDAEVELLSRWRGKGVNPNKYSLTPGEMEDVRALERGGEDVLDILQYTSQKMLDASEIYGSSSQSGGEMNKFLDTTGEVGIPKKKSKVARVTAEVGGRDGRSTTHSVETLCSGCLSTKECGEFVPSPTEVEATVPILEVPLGGDEGYIRAPMSSYYELGIRSIAKSFINTYFLEVDHQRAKDKVAA